jgi:hypothetical protein
MLLPEQVEGVRGLHPRKEEKVPRISASLRAAVFGELQRDNRFFIVH